jgi:deoxyribose-phosphate aldolase
MALDLAWVRTARVDRPAVDARVRALRGRVPHAPAARIEWLLRAVECTDLTTLQGDDTAARVRRLCAVARRPLRPALLARVGAAHRPVRVAAVCVYHAYIETALRVLAKSGVLVAAVSAGFPAGLSPLKARLIEIEESVAAGADEIDVVITRAHALGGAWRALYDEVRAFRAAAGRATLKVILATGELGRLTTVHRASLVAMMAGADFIKTSTGKEVVNATLPAGLVMARAIRIYRARSGADVGLKPAGGIRRAGDALEWMALVREELGDEYLAPARFRIGASSLLTDITDRLSSLARTSSS